VWLNTDEQDYDGLCVGRGTGRTDAITITLMAVDRLRNKLIELLAREGNK
jgi:hypothetical protein